MNEIDQQVVALQQKVEEKKKKISQAERPTWRTNCVIPTDKGNKNLQTVGSVEECVSLYAEIVSKSSSFRAAVEALGIKEKFTWGGFSDKDWLEDFKTRVAMISVVKERQKLRELEVALDSLESNELKRQKTLESIAKSLEE